MTQPWASLVAIGENRIETRGWSTRHRGPLAIHAAKGFPREARDLCATSPFREALARGGYRTATQLPVGALIALVHLDDVVTFDAGSLDWVRARSAAGALPPHEADFGDFSVGRFGWVLSAVQQLPVPVPVRGMLGLWEVPEAVERAARAQLR